MPRNSRDRFLNNADGQVCRRAPGLTRDDIAAAIERRGRHAQLDVRFVLFFGRRQKLRKAGGFADDQRQHPGRERIERAGMPNLGLAGLSSGARRAKEGAAHDGDDVVRRWSRRLVDDNYAVA